MEFLRTDDSNFVNLPDYPFTANYLLVDDSEGGQLRIHYLDEGDKDAEPILLLHGEPSWSFLYRKIIPILVKAGHRVIVPDLVGFGRSDKPSKRSDYTYQRHVDWIKSFVLQLELTKITLVCQDWGGLIGLRMAAEDTSRYSRIVAANTMLPTGDDKLNDAFAQWVNYSQEVELFPTGNMINGASVSDLSDDVIAAYDAPFPEEKYTQGARQFPLLVPATPNDPATEKNRAAWKVLSQWNKPFLTAFSDSDPITAGGDKMMQQMIPGAKGQKHTTIINAGHYLQEEQGEVLAEVIVSFIADNR
ncbi:haloalkane dehalogenase [Shewanella psychromarinicola]|uniref:Alpha/beta fold hydrolase n=1 Tax=Shewanella psychromarinicola TaxID=2487742 RepID=A0A3N4E5T3_9GAMM|nr:haloalkane dehalogenase [Shewanella psychromarinicola]AZG34653.1 alpha/beta fold hydrolase [Shewanella psychromarinicola]MCL1083902.1 haloalkane dehalogenase [Shewanella psychromarinicola]RPA33559.1 alpha/beta fold hydrolase [Shewanella psychromarinicola]